MTNVVVVGTLSTFRVKTNIPAGIYSLTGLILFPSSNSTFKRIKCAKSVYVMQVKTHEVTLYKQVRVTRSINHIPLSTQAGTPD